MTIPFGFGGSSSRTSSQSSSFDYGQQASRSFSDSLAQSSAQSGGTSFGTQNVWNANVLESLYADAMGAAGRTDTGLFTGQAADLFNSGNRFLESLQGGGAGEAYLNERMGGNPLLDQQIDALGGDLGRFFNEQLNPAITSQGVAGGTLGGGRQGVAQGMAMDMVGREFQQGALGLRAADMAARDQAAGQLMAGQTQRAAAGLGSLPGMAGVAEMGMGAEMAPYQMLSQILGGPAVLSESGSQDWSEASSQQIAQAISEAFGFNVGESQSTSSGKSKSFNFGLGG